MKNGKASKQIEICYSNSAKINKQNYEQLAPFYSAKSVIQGDCDEVLEFNRLRGIVDPLLQAQWDEEKLNMSKLRVRIKDGKKYVSVTSIITPDGLDFVKNIEQHALKGTQYHEEFNSYFNGKEPPIRPDIEPLKWDLNVKTFFELFGKRIGKPIELNKEVWNERHLFSGEIDYYGAVDNKLTIADVKTGSWKKEQLVAYRKCLEAEQLAIFDLKTPQIVIIPKEEWQDAWESFLIKRGCVLSRFGI